jgi:hypothetical protein
LSNDNSPKGGLLGPKSVAFWTVVAGIAGVIALFQTGPLAIPGVDGGPGSSVTRTDPGPGSSLNEGSDETSIPVELVGQWQGSGNQYANDAYTMRLDMTLAPDGGYLTIRDGVTQEQGIYAVDGPLIRFRPSVGSEYAWRWAFGNYGPRPVLRIQNGGGGIFELEKA